MNQAPEQIVDELIYRSYAYNRQRAPHIAPERWAPHFPHASQLEARLQADLAIAKAKS